MTLSGVAVDDDGRPLAGVRVVLAAQDGPFLKTRPAVVAETATGPDGRFRFEDVRQLTQEQDVDWEAADGSPTGRWAAWVFGVEAGRATAIAAFAWADYNWDVPAALPDAVTLTLGPAATFAGRIRFADGSPAAGLAVIERDIEGSWGIAGLRSARSGPDGRFSIDDLAPFRAVPSAVRDDGSPLPPNSVRYRPKGFTVHRLPPDAADPSRPWTGPGPDGYGSAPIWMELEVVPSRVDLTLQPLTTLRGTLTDENGKPAAGVQVMAEGGVIPGGFYQDEEFEVLEPPLAAARSRGERPTHGPLDWAIYSGTIPQRTGAAETDAEGRYVLPDLPAGMRFTVRALDWAGGRVAAVGGVAGEVGAEVEVPPLALTPGGLLEGEFRDQRTGRLWQRGRRRPAMPTTATLTPVDDAGEAAGEPVAVTADVTGRFAVPLPPGRYRVRPADPPAGAAWEESDPADGRTWREDGREVSAGGSETAVFRLTNESGDAG